MSILSDFKATHDALDTLIQSSSELSGHKLLQIQERLGMNLVAHINDLKDEVEAFSTVAFLLDQDFARIEVLLESVQKDTNSASDVVQLYDTWKSHRQTLLKALKNSREVAKQGDAAIQEFRDTFMDSLQIDGYDEEQNTKNQENSEMILDYISVLEKGQRAHQGTLDELQHDVESYIASWHTCAQEHDLDVPVQDAQSLATRANRILATRSDLQAKVSRFAVTTGVLKSQGVATSGYFVPTFWHSELCNALGNGTKDSALIDNLRGELPSLDHLLSTLWKDNTSFRDSSAAQELTMTLSVVASRLQQWTAGVATITNVWTNMIDDLKYIKGRLELENSGEEMRYLKAHMELVTRFWAFVARGLILYSRNAQPAKQA